MQLLTTISQTTLLLTVVLAVEHLVALAVLRVVAVTVEAVGVKELRDKVLLVV